MAPYILSNNSVGQFQLLATLSKSFSQRLQQKIPEAGRYPLNADEGGDTDDFDPSASTIDTLRYLTRLMLDGLHSFFLNRIL